MDEFSLNNFFLLKEMGIALRIFFGFSNRNISIKNNYISYNKMILSIFNIIKI